MICIMGKSCMLIGILYGESWNSGEEAEFQVMTVASHFLWRRQWQPTPVLLPGKSHGRRSLVGCSPWGRKESDSTERLHLWTLSLTIPFLPPHPSPVAQAHPFLFPHFARPAPHTCHLDYNISCCLAAGGLASSLAPPAGFATMTACCVKHGDEKQARTMQGQYAKVNSFYTLGMNSPYNESKTFPLTIASKRIKQTNLTDV